MSSNSLLSPLERRPRELSVSQTQRPFRKQPQLEGLQLNLNTHETNPSGNYSYNVKRPEERPVVADLFKLLVEYSLCAVSCQNHKGTNRTLTSLKVLV